MEAMNRKSREAAERQKMLNEVKETAAKRLAAERREIELLVGTAKDEKISLDARLDAVNKLNGIIPDYNARIDATTGKYQASTKALNEHLAALRKKIALVSMGAARRDTRRAESLERGCRYYQGAQCRHRGWQRSDADVAEQRGGGLEERVCRGCSR